MTVPELTSGDVELLTVIYYDGYPRAGSLRWRGERFYFEELTDGWCESRLGVYALTEVEWHVEDRRHADFERYVGLHGAYVDGVRSAGDVRPMNEWRRFSDAWRERPSLNLRAEPVAVWVRRWTEYRLGEDVHA